jgi:SAM-dependent methyltransferase
MNVLVQSDCQCQVCGAGSLREFSAFRSLPRVTSDAFCWPAGGRLCICAECGAVQKIVDAQWRAEIAEIYKQYKIYHQSSGAEQPIFSSRAGGPAPRSVLVAEFIDGSEPPCETGALLDFGCGNGAALRTFSKRRPRWRLYGCEQSDAVRDQLKQIDNFVELFTGEIYMIDHTFDLVTLIHSLEHVIEPAELLSAMRRLLGESGRLFVEVPDCGVNAYDLVIADHLTHFTLETLCRVTQRAGYETLVGTDAALPKELSWIGKTARRPVEAPPASPITAEAIGAQIAWLEAQLQDARRIAHTSPKFGIFGTSNSGTWMAGALGDVVTFFVDEDPGRVGREHMGRPIVAPEGVSNRADVFIPLATNVAESIARRHSDKSWQAHIPRSTSLRRSSIS